MRWNQFKAKEALQGLIKGKESRDEVVAPGKKGISNILEIKIFIPANPFTTETPGYIGEQKFIVHADTKIQEIVRFLNNVTDENISVAPGEKGSKRLGVLGAAPDFFYVYLKKS